MLGESGKGLLESHFRYVSIYLQIVDVLLGCVQFDWKYKQGYYLKTSKRAREKRMLVNLVKDKLGISSERTFGQLERTPLFTVSEWEW